MSFNLPVNKSIWNLIGKVMKTSLLHILSVQYLWRGKNNKYTLIFFVFAKTTIISSCRKAEKITDMPTNPFPYLLPTKIKRLCLEEFNQHLFPATMYRSRHCPITMNWGNTHYCLSVGSSCSLTSLDKRSKNLHFPVMKYEIYLIPQTLIMIISLSRTLFHLLFHL